MTPYHYSVVRCRDFAVRGEHRNVGLLVIAPELRKAWLRRGSLQQRAHLVGDDAAFVRAVLDLLEDEAQEVAKGGAPEVVHEWLRRRAAPSEDSLSLAGPAIGIAGDVGMEVRRLAALYLGKAPARSGANAADRVQLMALRALGVERAFVPAVFKGGPVSWRFPRVHLGDETLVLQALHFGQRTPKGLLDAAFKNVGRVAEVRHFNPGTSLLTVATGPHEGETGAAFKRALQVMDHGGLQLVKPDAAVVESALRQHGIGLDEPGNATA